MRHEAAPLTLVLVRHGLTDWNERGRLMGRYAIGLNARGRAQIERTARFSMALDVGVVVASPQRRAHETAEILARAHGVAVETDEGLDEVWLGPRWQGRTFGELRGDPDLERMIADPTYVCEVIEPLAPVQQRMVAVVERVRAEREGTVLLVSHGDPLRALLAYFLAMPLREFRRITVDNGALSVMRFTPRGPRLLLLNARPMGEALELVSG